MKERRVDALALRADERRDKLRKASGRSKYPLIRRGVAASETGRAQTGVRAPRGSDRGIDLLRVAEWFWESQPERVKAP